MRLTFPCLALLLAHLAGCSSEDDAATGTTTPRCTPGQTVACSCSGDSSPGAQTCRADGSAFEACNCGPQAGAGGQAQAGQGGGGGTPGGSSGASGQPGAGQGGASGGQAGAGGSAQGGVGGSSQGGAGGSNQAGAGNAGGASAGQGGASAGGAGQGGAGSGGAGGGLEPIETCAQAAQARTSVGCEFWAVDLDQQDGAGNDPASTPWGLTLTATSASATTVVIESNEAAVGQPLALTQVMTVSLAAGETKAVTLPTREVDCGVKPNDYASPGTCLSSRAVRVTATAPLAVQQFNTATSSFSNDASLLLPTSALGQRYRAVGWGAGHPVPVDLPGLYIIDRSYLTIVGVMAGTKVKVKPTFRIKGNAPIAAVAPGQTLEVTLGPFDVLNLETDDMTQEEQDQNPSLMADLSGSLIEASGPVVVFSGTETAGVPGPLQIPTPPGWISDDACCLDHLEEQLAPLETLGRRYVVGHSPYRSTDGAFKEADVLRFVGGEVAATVKTSLPAPFAQFTLAPGEVKDTWTQGDVVVDASAPIAVAQLLVSKGYVSGMSVGDPSLLQVPSVEQYLSRYSVALPTGWDSSHVVLTAPPSTQVKLDGQPLTGCSVAAAGTIAGTAYEARRCALPAGAHTLVGDQPFGLAVYAYGTAGSYAYVGGLRATVLTP